MLRPLLFTLLLAIPFVTAHGEAPAVPQIPWLQLDAAATGRVPYDTARATLFVEREGAKPTEPTRQVSEALAAVLAEAKALKGVEARTGNYTTRPVFDRSCSITGYRVRAEVLIESRSFPDFSDALGKLSSQAPIAHVTYDVSPAARAAEEERLLKDAADAFRKKAQAAAQALGFPRYSLLEIHVGGEGRPMPRSVRAFEAGVAAAAAPPPPPIEPEEATITVVLSGKVHLEGSR